MHSDIGVTNDYYLHSQTKTYTCSSELKLLNFKPAIRLRSIFLQQNDAVMYIVLLYKLNVFVKNFSPKMPSCSSLATLIAAIDPIKQFKFIAGDRTRIVVPLRYPYRLRCHRFGKLATLSRQCYRLPRAALAQWMAFCCSARGCW